MIELKIRNRMISIVKYFIEISRQKWINIAFIYFFACSALVRSLYGNVHKANVWNLWFSTAHYSTILAVTNIFFMSDDRKFCSLSNDIKIKKIGELALARTTLKEKRERSRPVEWWRGRQKKRRLRSSPRSIQRSWFWNNVEWPGSRAHGAEIFRY